MVLQAFFILFILIFLLFISPSSWIRIEFFNMLIAAWIFTLTSFFLRFRYRILLFVFILFAGTLQSLKLLDMINTFLLVSLFVGLLILVQ